jgi:hypothetical protein
MVKNLSGSVQMHRDDGFDSRLRRHIYRHFIQKGRAPKVTEMAASLSTSRLEIKNSLERLARNHAIVLQETGELWRAAPFSAVSTAFPVLMGSRHWWANCIWDALGISAMLGKDAQIDASCGCCNLEMIVRISEGRLTTKDGTIHFAVPARNWYDDVVFT